MFNPVDLLKEEQLNATQKSYEYMKKIREGNYSRTKLKQLEERRDYWQNADLIISRLIELFNKEMSA